MKPSRYFSKKLAATLICIINFYRRFLSPMLPSSCKYYPSCSQYAIEVIKSRGPLKGSLLTIKRLLKCNPWSRGGYDPVDNYK